MIFMHAREAAGSSTHLRQINVDSTVLVPVVDRMAEVSRGASAHISGSTAALLGRSEVVVLGKRRS